MEKLRVEALRREHDRTGFDCGEESLNVYLARYAGQNDRNDLGRTFVLTAQGDRRVLGYYTLSAGSVQAQAVPALRLPYPVPVALLGRLAVDRREQGKGYGEHLLLDAVRRAVQASREMAVYAIAVDALNEAAKAFYQRYGFQELQDDPLHLFLALKQARKLPL